MRHSTKRKNVINIPSKVDFLSSFRLSYLTILNSYLADRPLRISHINQQIFAFQIKMHNVLSMQILHPKCSIHCYDESLATIYSSVQLHYDIRYLSKNIMTSVIILSTNSLYKLEQTIKTFTYSIHSKQEIVVNIFKI